MVFGIETINVGFPLINDILNTFITNVDTITISAITIAIYAIVIWHYYRLLAKRDFFHFQGKKGEGAFVWFMNFLEEIEFLAKYIIVYPLLSFIFFGIFSIMMFLLSKDQSIPVILITAVTIISATRISAYYNEDLSRDLAKLIPFALLGVFIVQANFFDTGLLMNRISELPNFFVDIAAYLLYFLVLELGLRILYSLKKLFLGGTGISRRDKVKLQQKVREVEEKQKIEQRNAALEYAREMRNK
ncbi:MAG: hypothetical protein HON47_05085 [Candidatus Diapherotrites archaeon]|uniref:Uncharacterized protein n=1 Tax=Candidatus Iainarchaeum sp. TaxID=3101447 RepID=A0A8T5GFX2_9ARCH|nr:hypothetical protein [Candidatus Diapherotrites archaeon]